MAEIKYKISADDSDFKKKMADVRKQAAESGSVLQNMVKKGLEGGRNPKIGLLENLKTNLKEYKQMQFGAMDPNLLRGYNKEIQDIEGEMKRMTNAGKKGFDEMGNAVKKSTNLMGKAWSSLRMIANILPGLGIAGILSLAIGPLVKLISNLDIFKIKLSEAQKEAVNLSNAFASGEYRKAITSISELKLNIDLAKKGLYSKTAAVDEYNKSIGIVSGQVNSLNEAEIGLGNNADAYVKMTLYKAAANLALGEAAEESMRIEKLRMQGIEQEMSYAGKLWQSLINMFQNPNLRTGGELEAEYDKRLDKMTQKEIDKAKESETAQMNIAERLQKRAAEIASSMGGLLGTNTLNDTKGMGKSLTAVNTMYQKIEDLKTKYNRKVMSPDEAELQAVRDEFKKISDEVKSFNANPKNKIKVKAEPLQELQKAAITDLEYKQDTVALKIELEKQRSLFSDHEKFKLETTKELASQRYGAEMAEFDTFEKYLEDKQQKLYDKVQVENLSGGEVERLKYINAQLEAERARMAGVEANDFKIAYQESMNLEEKILRIKEMYAKKASDLGKALSAERKAELEQQEKGAIQSATDEAFKKTEIYKKLGEEALVLTRSQLKEQIQAIEELLSDGSITGVIKDQLETQLSNLKLNLNLGVKSFNLTNLEAEKKTVKDAIDKYLELNNIGAFDALSQSAIDANPELKKLIDRLKEVAGIIVKVNKAADDGGGGLKGFLAKLTGNEGLQKFAEWGQMAASSFNEMSNALGGVDTAAGYALDNVSQLVGSAADIGGALVSGNPVQIVGSIIKGVSSVFSIGRKVKEMNAAARQSIADFYAAAIAGEREYQELLDQRAIESVKNNNVRLNAIREEIALRKKKADADAKEYSDLMSQVQKSSYIKDQEYKHGTWFRKAKTTNVMGSLRGKDFEELSSLLSQGKLEGETKALVERLVELEQQGYDASKAMADLAKETSEIFTGTTADNLTDSLANMFREGKTGAKDLADFFESTMGDAAISIFKNKVLADSMDKFYKRFSEVAQSDEGLTENSISMLRREWIEGRQKDAKDWEDWQKVTGVSQQGSGQTNGITNSVQGVREVSAKQLQNL